MLHDETEQERSPRPGSLDRAPYILPYFVEVAFIKHSCFSYFNKCVIDNCYILEKSIHLCNINNHNDVVIINVHTCRSRYAKYLYYNCTRVVCECHREVNVTESQVEYQLKSYNASLKRTVFQKGFKYCATHRI